MSEPGTGQPAGPADDWPFDQTGQDYDYPDLGVDGPESAQPYAEWHHDGTVHGDTGPWDYLQDLTSPAEWAGSGTYVPEPDGQTKRRYGPTEQYGPREPGPRRAAGHRRARRFPWHAVTITALLLAAIAAVTVATFPHDGSGAPAGGPGATATSGTGVTIGGGQSASAQRPAITKKQAKQVVSHYWEVNNEANEQRSDSLLGTVEEGSSYRMDTGAYRFDRASNPSGAGYAPFDATHTAYYIPWQSASAAYPHWFAVAVTIADLTSPQHPTGSGYLVFSQASPGASWKDVVEPDMVTGSGPTPQIATDAKGYATQVDDGTSGLSIAPGKISPMTASALDNPGTATIKVPGTLADEMDEAHWRSRLPAGSTDSDKHQAGAGPVFGLRTKDGGAVLFYSVSAQLALATPPGHSFELDIPGYYSCSQTLTSADIGYIEQFAAYVPPAGHSGSQIVADVSSIASRD
jgi:hypothetical protein